MAPKRSFTLNPYLSQYAAAAAVVLSLVIGLLRYSILDRVDPLHCHALSSRGRWLDEVYGSWQPDGCMLHTYQEKDIKPCLKSKRLVFIGDSVTRQLYFQMAHALDSTLPAAPVDDDRKHADHDYTTSYDVRLSFYWDPFLNTSTSLSFIHSSSPPGSSTTFIEERPAMLVLGTGLWYLRYADTSGGLPAWEAMMENVLEVLSSGQDKPADLVLVLPVEEVVPSKLSPDRASTMHASDIDAMNSDLTHRIRPPTLTDPFTFTGGPTGMLPVSFPSVFNQMLDPTQTEDGLHFSASVVKTQANILLNLRCNDELPKAPPFDTTCCRSYPWPSLLHLLVLAAIIIWGPLCWFLGRRYGPRTTDSPLVSKEQLPWLVISASIALIYTADRTGYWLKEHKQFNPWTFAFLCIVSLAVGLLSSKRADSDQGILNRDQTDEWKGWMQIAILIYHYLGASKISGIYNPIRVLVASYLFMTGYGHMTYYVKKADFGVLRVAQILVRLNLFTLLLAYTMNTDYIFYYFSPLVSWWYLIIYGTMFAGSRFNESTPFLVIKLLLSMVLVTVAMKTSWLLEGAFAFLERICGIHWSAREWAFRVNLDIWIVYVGMFTALAVIKSREYRLTDHPHWPLVMKVASAVSVLALVWFFAFELSMNKFDYNLYHPLVSCIPVLAFVVLRNSTEALRSSSSRAFAFIGKCSLETFIIQYHFWLAGDTKGILVVIRGARWRPLNLVLTTLIFVCVSHYVANATGELTKWICSDKPKGTLPTTTNNTRPSAAVQEVIFQAPEEALELPVRKDQDGNVLPPEPDTPARPTRRWVDRLAEGSSPQSPRGFRLWYGETEWTPGVKSRMLIGLGVMWLLNILWTYPKPNIP
ncbi:O-acetyltransferase [Phanerochaete sordida]|uniref:O-acetyltransferase n=1 Tax=Phanerochaete sordida TaxID=48140 RepID=A0A9P3GTV5_9APHY|nr:O-acetyltransferase [Phanerochaete sordida]